MLQTISDSFASQEVISYDIPIQLSLPLGLLYLLAIQGNPELLDAQRTVFLTRKETPVNFLDLGSIFVCASTAPQVSP